MAKKKDFALGGTDLPLPYQEKARALTINGESAFLVQIEFINGSSQNYDFCKYANKGFDQIMSAFLHVICEVRDSRPQDMITIAGLLKEGARYFFEFCAELCNGQITLTLKSIDPSFIEIYAGWLSNRTKENGELWSRNTARTAFSKTKTVLKLLIERRLVENVPGLLPRGLFPGATSPLNRRKKIRSLSENETDKVLAALIPVVTQIYYSETILTRKSLSFLALAIFLSIGVNVTPLFSMQRDLSLHFFDHPMVNRKLLYLSKKRANKEIVTPLEDGLTVSLDVFKICMRVKENADKVAAQLGSKAGDQLWIYRSQDGEKLRILSHHCLSDTASSFATVENLERDDGRPLKMSSQLFRNTRHNKIAKASRGNLLAIARSSGNTPRVASRYLDVSAEQTAKHRFAGEALVEKLIFYEKTPVASCKDIINGDLAPKTGEPCLDFFSCFRCKSQVITGDDLYRLYSFYWAIYRERAHIGAKKWKAYFSWLIRVIDRDIAPLFKKEAIKLASETARDAPHPMWRSREALLIRGAS